jgi:hypothetical protein
MPITAKNKADKKAEEREKTKKRGKLCSVALNV